MRKHLASLLLVACAAAGLAGCDVHVQPYAAVVGGSTVSQSTLDSALSSAAADAGYVCSISADFTKKTRTGGAGSGTYDSQFVATILGWFVRSDVLAETASADRLQVTPVAVTLAEDQLDNEYGTAANCPQSATTVLQGLSPAFHGALVSFFEDLLLVGAHQAGISLTASGLAAYAAAHPQATVVDCLNFIQAPSQAEAEQAESAIAKGTSFDAEADAVMGTSNDSAGCAPIGELPAAIVAALAPLQIGGISSPVANQGSWLIFQLVSHATATTADIANEAISSVDFSTLLDKLMAAQPVQLDPAYGSWSDKQGGAVDPLSGPPAVFVYSTGAAVAPYVSQPAASAPQG